MSRRISRRVGRVALKGYVLTPTPSHLFSIPALKEGKGRIVTTVNHSEPRFDAAVFDNGAVEFLLHWELFPLSRSNASVS